jgi:hypothetical protein
LSQSGTGVGHAMDFGLNAGFNRAWACLRR